MGKESRRFFLTLIRSCECPLAHPCDWAGLFSILLPKCKPNQIRSLLKSFVIAQCPGIKTALPVTSRVPRGPALLPSPASFPHTLPLLWSLSCWLSSAFGIQCLAPPPGFSRPVLSAWESCASCHFVDSSSFLRFQLECYLQGSLDMQLTTFFFYWRIVELQCCVSFRHTAKWISYTHTYIHSIGEGTGDPLLYSCLENPVDGGAWWAAVHGVASTRSRLSNFTFTFHFHALEKEMATHSSVLAWRIPGMGAPGGLPSMGSHRVGHDWRDLAAAAAAYPLFPILCPYRSYQSVELISLGYAVGPHYLFYRQ